MVDMKLTMKLLMQRKLVLIAVDDSEHALRAFHWFRENLLQSHDEVMLFYAAQTPAKALPRAKDEHLRKIEILQNDYLKLCHDCGVKNSQFVHETTKAIGEAIVRAASQFNADVLVMGCRGMSSVKRAFKSSISDYVLHNCSKPVIIVPPLIRK